MVLQEKSSLIGKVFQNILLRKCHYDSIFLFCEWSDRKAISLLEYLHTFESRSQAELCDRDDTREFLYELDIHTLPYRLLASRLRVIVLVPYDELCLICMGT